jgi:hypothetical protein
MTSETNEHRTTPTASGAGTANATAAGGIGPNALLRAVGAKPAMISLALITRLLLGEGSLLLPAWRERLARG